MNVECCVVCGTRCEDLNPSWRRITEKLPNRTSTIEEFLLSKDVIPAGETALGQPSICHRCHELVFSCDELQSQVDSRVGQLREFRQRVVDSVLETTTAHVDDFFGDAETNGDKYTDLTGLHMSDDLLSDEEYTRDCELKEDEFLVCSKCPFKCKSSVDLVNHRLLCDSNDHPYCCEICNAWFKFESSLATHREKEHQCTLKFSCDRCGVQIISKSSLEIHKRKCELKELKVCDTCGETVEATKYNSHVMKHVTSMNGKYGCDVCMQVFYKQRKSLRRHLWEKHGMGRPFTPQPTEKTCEMCGQSYRCGPHFIAHMFKKHGVKLPGLVEYKCSICNKVFHVKQGYDVHMGSHRNNPRYSCLECGYKTQFSSSFAAHKRLHTVPGVDV